MQGAHLAQRVFEPLVHHMSSLEVYGPLVDAPDDPYVIGEYRCTCRSRIIRESGRSTRSTRALDALPDAPTGLAREAWLPSALSSLVEPMEATPPAGDQPLVVR